MFKPDNDTAYHLYGAVVTQARQSAFYSDLSIPDTLDGRFDMIILHAFMVFRRLEETGESGHRLAQQTFDVMFQDMDQSLREMGVGDLSVPKKIKVMAKAVYGRVAAYSAALEQQETNALENALQRNIYPEVPEQDHASRHLADYVRATLKQLGTLSYDDIAALKINFPTILENQK